MCKEYLISDELTSSAVVYYPISEETGRPDLTRGTVLRLMNTPDAICGGTIVWNTEANSFTYNQGSQTSINKFYVSEDGTISLTSGSNAVSCDVVSLTIRDTRDAQPSSYPIVKIGTQYWMKEDLRATCYKDGTPLKKLEQLGIEAAYFKPEGLEYYFYNGEAVLAGELSPEGWNIPSDKDWEALKSYTGDNTSLLKTGTWLLETDNAGQEQEGDVAPVNERILGTERRQYGDSRQNDILHWRQQQLLPVRSDCKWERLLQSRIHPLHLEVTPII